MYVYQLYILSVYYTKLLIYGHIIILDIWSVFIVYEVS